MKKIPFIQNFRTIILANGLFPSHQIPLSFIKNAERIICCDGATESLIESGREPDYIVGDLDSLSSGLHKKYCDRIFHNPDQETNDLTKAIHFCIERNWKEITILGATGKREAHSLGNISLLIDYQKQIDVQMITDSGVFIAIFRTGHLESTAGQQISLFSLNPNTLFTTSGLKYPLNKRPLTSWWQGTLNEALSDSFTIEFEQGKLLIFREFSL